MNMTSILMRRLITGVAIGAVLLSLSARAAEPPAIPRIGVITPVHANLPMEEGLREGLRELGYLEPKTLIIERWPSQTTKDELLSVVAKLVHSKPDVIVVFSTAAARAALDITAAPVVFVSGDPVASGLAESLARPGGNATGISILSTELTAKRLELLHQLAPRVRRIAYLMNPANPIGPQQFEDAQRTARALGLELVKLDASNAGELDTALRTLSRSSADGVLVTGDALFYLNKAKIASVIGKAKLPAMFPGKEYQGDGVVMSYGPSLKEAGRKIATYIDKILKGAKPAELPIEQMSKYEFVIDLRVARAQGLHVSQELLVRADEVIR